jgi:NAD(P)H-flavin reductase
MIVQGVNTSPVLYPQGNRHIQKLKEPIEITLVGKDELATDTFVYRFALPDEKKTLGHHTCQYLEFEAEILNKETG